METLLRPLFLMLLLGNLVLVGCSCSDTQPQIDDPQPTLPPVPTPVPVSPPAFTTVPRYTMVVQVVIQDVSGEGSHFFENIRKGAATWLDGSNDFTLTLYVVGNSVFRQVENGNNVFLTLYRPDAKWCWDWQTSVADRKTVVKHLIYRHAYTGHGLDDTFNWSGKWSIDVTPELTFKGIKCKNLILTQDDGSKISVLVDGSGNLVHFQGYNNQSILCDVVSFTPGLPDPALFLPPKDVFVEDQ